MQVFSDLSFLFFSSTFFNKAGTSETKADDSDHDNTNQGLLEQKVCKECIRLSNGAAVLDTQVVLGDTECTQEDQVTEFIQPTPSIDNISESQSSFQTSWINDIIGQNETEEDRRELTWAKGPFRDKINASKICTVTCVTLQNFEVKERKSVHLQRRPVYPRRHLPERKGTNKWHNFHLFKVYITSVGILNVCSLWILLRKIVIYLVGRKCRLHGLFSC